MQGRHAVRGFTLVEVLVAISVMALMALMTWRGLDGMLRSQRELQTRADQLRTLQAGLAQWQTDLDQLADLSNVHNWDWDGKVLRLTRHTSMASDVLVVAWLWRQDLSRPGGGDWMRWQSAPLHTWEAWQQAWQNAQLWSQTPTDDLRRQEVRLYPLNGWQLWVHRGGSWTHPLSSETSGSNAKSPTPSFDERAPDAVRLTLNLPSASPIPGKLTLDWIKPTFTGAGS